MNILSVWSCELGLQPLNDARTSCLFANTEVQEDEEQAGHQQEEQQSDEGSPHFRDQGLPQLASLRRQQVAQGQHVSQGPTH